MSHVTRKPVFRVSDQVRLKPAYSATETSYSLEILDLASIGITANNKAANQTTRVRRLICAVVVCIGDKQVFSWCGSYNPKMWTEWFYHKEQGHFWQIILFIRQGLHFLAQILIKHDKPP